MRGLHALTPVLVLSACGPVDKECETPDQATGSPVPQPTGADTSEPRQPTGETGVAGETGDTGLGPRAVTELNIVCPTPAEVSLTPTTSGPQSTAAVLNMIDLSSADSIVEEHDFPALTLTTFGALTLTAGVPLAQQVPNSSTTFSCADHFAAGSAVMTYAVRLYDFSGVVADCQVGSENGDEAAAIAALFEDSNNNFPSNSSELAGCQTALALTY